MTATLVEQLVRISAPLLLGAFAAGCEVGQSLAERRATANIEARSGSTVTGTASFVAAGNSVSLTLTISGASPGQHGVHLHAVGDCSDANAASAMGHWNPAMMMHGLPTVAVHHLGDCGNFEVATDGTGVLTFAGDWSIGTGEMTDILGKAIIVHANIDDGVSQTPTPGNAGARQGCGVITAQ